MRILLYNWVPAGSAITEGGGVALYLDNLVDGLLEAGHKVDVLSSGFRYDLLGSRMKTVQRRSKRSRARYFDVINSPVAAPSYFMFSAVARTLECPPLVAALESFLRRNGPYDLFHIQNMEGLSFDILGLAKVFAQTRFVLTNHNYHLVCQQANLWRQDEVRCTDYGHGAQCQTCNVFPIDMDEVAIDRFIRFHRLDKQAAGVSRFARAALRTVARARRVLGGGPLWPLTAERRYQGERQGPADLFRLRRHAAIELVNANCFRVLSVSRATETILLSHGLSPELSRVSYIGTRHYKPQRPQRIGHAGGPMSLAFLGYTRPDKGFHFLASAIEAMPQRLHGKFLLTIAAKVSDPAALARIEACSGAFAKLDIHDGYAQAELPALLKDIDLGLVLPQWDDALPQVAIEFVCHGVPILSTDRGGQQELAGDAAFIFDAKSITDFWLKLERLQTTPQALARFWTVARPLRSNAEHVAELVGIYAGQDPGPDNQGVEPAAASDALPTRSTTGVGMAFTTKQAASGSLESLDA